MDGPVERVAVLGAGTMGRGISTALLTSGFGVTIVDEDAAVAAAAAADVSSRVERRRGSARDLTTATSIEEAVEGADVVIESVTELFEVKAEVLTRVLAAAPECALITSNTSTMSIGRLDAAAGGTARLVGMHFFNPAEKMRLVEIAVAPGTPGDTVARCEDLARRMGKTTIVVRDVPGFVTSRLGLILGNEAMRLLEDGVASATAIDTAMRLGYNHPMGPLELADLVGLDARLNNLRALHEASGDERLRPPEVLVTAVSEGRLGRKAGRGFYRYDDQGRPVVESAVHE